MLDMDAVEQNRLQLAIPATWCGVSVLGVAYAMLESILPLLTGQIVAATLLLVWWAGWLFAAIRYR